MCRRGSWSASRRSSCSSSCSPATRSRRQRPRLRRRRHNRRRCRRNASARFSRSWREREPRLRAARANRRSQPGPSCDAPVRVESARRRSARGRAASTGVPEPLRRQRRAQPREAAHRRRHASSTPGGADAGGAVAITAGTRGLPAGARAQPALDGQPSHTPLRLRPTAEPRQPRDSAPADVRPTASSTAETPGRARRSPDPRRHRHRNRAAQPSRRHVRRARDLPGHDAGLLAGPAGRPDSAPARACSAPPRRCRRGETRGSRSAFIGS